VQYQGKNDRDVRTSNGDGFSTSVTYEFEGLALSVLQQL
jgi:hypothetical protein